MFLLITFSLLTSSDFCYAQQIPSLAVPAQSSRLTPEISADGLGTFSDIAQRYSVVFSPPVLRGMTVHPENPLLFDFIVDRGQDKIGNELLKDESTKLIKYFLTSMTIPDKDAWVNLSPTEKDRIIPDALSQTEMGKVMLEQDYVLKQLAASLTNPETDLGKKYWDELTKGNIPVGNGRDRSLQNKVWIVPDGATVVEKDGFAYITQSKLTVMLDEDRSLDGQRSVEIDAGAPSTAQNDLTPPLPLFKKEGGSISTAVFRELILPKLVEEVNSGKNFAATRQVYQSVILAAWYKRVLKDSLLGKIYADKSKIVGVETDVKDIKQKIYQQYLEAFKKGAYNIIKEENGVDGELIARKYFSGGYIMSLGTENLTVDSSSSSVAEVVKIILQEWSLNHHDWIIAQFLLESKFLRETSNLKGNQFPLAGVILKITGLKIDDFDAINYDHWGESLIRFSENNSVENQKKFAEITQRLQLGQRQNVKSEIEDEFFRNLKFKPDAQLSSFIDLVLDRIEALDVFWTLADDTVIEFFRYKKDFIGQDTGPLTDIIRQIILAAGVFQRNGKKIIVQRVDPEDSENPKDSKSLRHPGQHTYKVTWGNQTYNIKIGNSIQPISPRIKNHADVLKRLNLSAQDVRIAKLVLSGNAQGHDFIVTTHMQGLSLKDKISYDDQPLPYPQWFEFAKELAQVVKSVHDGGFIVADLTLGNIQIWQDGDADGYFSTDPIKVFLFDFDISFPIGYNWQTDTAGLKPGDMIIGISQRRGFDSDGHPVNVDMQNVDIGVDIAYFGKAIFFAMTGTVLNDINQISEQTVENPAVRKIIRKTILSHSQDGYANMAEVLADLDALPDIKRDPLRVRSQLESPEELSEKTSVGGIDFDASKLNLQIERDKYGMPINLPGPNLERMDNIQGFFPVIINIAPINSRTLPILGQFKTPQVVVPAEG